ncbi:MULTISPECIES: O-antigen ligase family protein [unclassified Methylococcus]|uniref:O-antigen ligase family protein n=1 Tax=unclassified Methylococcus TaxID=2618889 RepID=UPI003D7DB773
MFVVSFTYLPVSISSLKPERRLYIAGWFASILLPNHDIINYALNGTPLVIWKQLLALVLLVLSIPVISVKRSIINGRTGHIRAIVKALMIMVAVLAVTSMIEGISIIRVGYAVIGYIGFVGAFGFAVSVISLGKTLSVLRLYTILGVVSSVGLIIDYLTGWLDFLPRTGEWGMDEQIERQILRRASFLFGASNTIAPFMLFAVLAAALLLMSSANKKDTVYSSMLFILAPIGLFFSGSRSALLLEITFFVGLVFILSVGYIRRKKGFFGVMGVMIFVFSFVFVRYIDDIEQSAMLLDRYSNAFDEADRGNDHRYERWREGAELFMDFDIYSIIGNGLGSSSGAFADDMKYNTHYESSLFQAFSEGGYFGLMLRYLPFFCALIVMIRHKCGNDRFVYQAKIMLLLWLIVYFASVFSAPIAGAYFTQFVYFMVVAFVLNLDRFCLINSRETLLVRA